jgi:hypothetical protein
MFEDLSLRCVTCSPSSSIPPRSANASGASISVGGCCPKMEALKPCSISLSIVSMDDIDESPEEMEESSSILSIEGAVEEPLLEEESLLSEIRRKKSNNGDGGIAASTPLCA